MVQNLAISPKHVIVIKRCKDMKFTPSQLPATIYGRNHRATREPARLLHRGCCPLPSHCQLSPNCTL